MSEYITTLSHQHFTRRQQAARRLVGRGKWGREQAHARLLPWLALALRCGAEPREVAAQLADYCAAGCTPQGSRLLVATDLCTAEDMAAELAQARREATGTEAEDLATLAAHLHLLAETNPEKELA